MRYTHAMLRKHLGITMQSTWWKLLKRSGYCPKPLGRGRWRALTKLEATKVMSFWYAWKGGIEEKKLRKAQRAKLGDGPVIPEAVRGKGFAPKDG